MSKTYILFPKVIKDAPKHSNWDYQMQRWANTAVPRTFKEWFDGIYLRKFKIVSEQVMERLLA